MKSEIAPYSNKVVINNPRANGARVLIPHGYLHPGKGKHSKV